MGEQLAPLLERRNEISLITGLDWTIVTTISRIM